MWGKDMRSMCYVDLRCFPVRGGEGRCGEVRHKKRRSNTDVCTNLKPAEHEGNVFMD